MTDSTDDRMQDSEELMPNENSASGEKNSAAEQTAGKTVLSGMFRDWYLEYASYVILERAVPYIEDGLKPVQRRILHAMQTIDDGRFTKVANIVGNTMQYHPHGDASIGDALVQLGQKELLIDTQGNWGNVLTGDTAAAPRYIEARLSEFALETVFNPKVTEWTMSYDGRKPEPVTLPVKFPLLLAQGVEGIAVGLSSKILPHNFNEILDAAVAYLESEEFHLYPDFQTGGYLDVSRYNDGARGGSLKARAKIEKRDAKTLAITEVPFGKTTTSLITSILAAQEKGKIKIRHVDDNTAAQAEILVQLLPGTSSDKAIDALYAFTDCEVSISPNCCVICEQKPCFMSVSDLLRESVDHTRELLRRELEIKLAEAQEARLFASLEKIFIENRIYKDRELEIAEAMEHAVAHIDKRLEPWKPSFFREVTEDDIMRLWEIKMGRILKFNSEKAEQRLARLEADIERYVDEIEHITDYTIRWYKHLKEKYGANFQRRTVLREFDSIEATKVAEANKRLYFDRAKGFVGTNLKEGEFLFTCSDLDDLIIFYNNGTYKLVKVQDKFFTDKNVKYIGLFKKGDKRMVYNIIYRNGKEGYTYKKRCFITGLTRDKEYNLTKGLPGSKILWFSANPNGEAETVKVRLKEKPDKNGKRPRQLEFPVDFATLEIKGKDALGNLVTKYDVDKITLKELGRSTLGGRQVWFDRDVLRLNYEGRGESLGEFQGNDKVLVVLKNGEYFTTSYADSNHYPEGILLMRKFDPSEVWTVALYDPAAGYHYLKRFMFEPTVKPQRFAGQDETARIDLITNTAFPRLHVKFGGADSVRPDTEIDAEEFIGVKSFKAKGKRLSNFTVGGIVELEPTRFPEPPEEPEIPEQDTAEDEEDADESPKVVQGDLFAQSESAE